METQSHKTGREEKVEVKEVGEECCPLVDTRIPSARPSGTGLGVMTIRGSIGVYRPEWSLWLLGTGNVSSLVTEVRGETVGLVFPVVFAITLLRIIRGRLTSALHCNRKPVTLLLYP